MDRQADNERKDSENLICAESNEPFLIHEPDSVWIVRKSRVNLFAVKKGDHESYRNYVCTIEKDEAIFGIKSTGDISLLAVGEAGTELEKLSFPGLGDQSAPWIQRWLENLTKGLAIPAPASQRLLLTGEGDDTIAEKDENISSLEPVIWIRHLEGSSLFFDMKEAPCILSDSFFPLTRYSWTRYGERSRIRCCLTQQYISEDPGMAGLERFHETFLFIVKLLMEKKEEKEKESMDTRQMYESQALRASLQELACSTEDRGTSIETIKPGGEPLFDACSIVAGKMGITLKLPVTPGMKTGPAHSMSEILRASKIRARKVTLQDGWWRRDSGPLLGFLKETDKPVALLPCPGGYRIADPGENGEIRIDRKIAETLDTKAYLFYRPFPGKSLTLWDIFLFSIPYLKSDLRIFLLIGTATGFLGMLIPIATGIIINYIVPRRELPLLWMLAVALLTTSLSAALFQFAQSIAIIRMQGKTKGAVQSALWDKLLSLPCAFYNKYSSGDLAMCSLGFDSIMSQVFEGLAMPSILGAIYASFNLILIYYYNSTLAGIATAFALSLFAALVLTSYLQLRNIRKEISLQGQLWGFVFQLINGISKLKVAGAQALSFSEWAEKFTRQKGYSYRAAVINNYFEVFNSVLPLISIMAIFTFAALREGHLQDYGRGYMSVGNLLAFNAAFMGFLMAMIQLGTAVSGLLRSVPMFDRMKPIFEAEQEVDERKLNPGELTGGIEVSNMSFRYKSDGPLVLKNISFSVKPGEFVAFVGASGSGKSTIFRNLLGFEVPEQGAIYYDGRDLSTLDITAVRNQIGTVLQKSELMYGDIFYNIAGSSCSSIEDAWEAARIAGIDEDIKAMPMGMQTMVMDGGLTFSGGQKQRLLIASAVAKKPRILLLDEATSAIDNRIQSMVTEQMLKLNATKILIAQRLSTVVNVDRIYVVEEGKIVQAGTYKELMSTEGPFRKLAERQLA